MIKIIAAVLAVLVVIVLGLAASKPDHFRVERKVLIKAPAAKIFVWLDDPKRALEWSPWEKKDPQVKKTFSGKAQGVGAVYDWDGNNDVGSGRLEITEVVASKKVVMDLQFFRPMKGRSTAEYNLAAQPDGSTEVTWSIAGPSPFLSKLMCVFMNMDKMIGADFEKGLGDLKSIAENRP